VGAAVAVLGLLLFVSGYIGAATGFVLLPFDRHHLVSQAGGLVLAVAGLRLASR
jgi:hypothetical protein